MKTAGKVVALLILLAVMLSVSGGVFAEDQTYMVRVYAGNQGTIDGETEISATVTAGGRFSFDIGSVTVTDEKYYARGIREAGLDNAQVYGGNTVSIVINEDIDFVVAYGMKSTAVKYTVNYVGTDGTKLVNSQTFFGNVGDKPVVAFVYIDGYQPQAYNLTKTLSENEADNVFTFTYSKVATTTVITPVNDNTNNNQNNQNNNQNANAANNNQNANANSSGTNQSGTGAGQGASSNGQETTPTAPTQPEEIIDLDVPMAGPSADNADSGSHMKFPALVIALGVLALLATILVLARVLSDRKKNEQEE